MGDTPNIRNRITEVRKMRLGDVAHNPQNWRGHPSGQRQAFQGVVREIGWAGMPLVYHSERTGALTYVDGHMRKEELPDLEAEVAITDLNDAEADLLLAAYDPLAAMAEANREKLGALLQDVQSDEAAVQAMLSELAEREGVVFGGNGQPPEDPGPQVDRAEELHAAWGVELGQVWELGEHRLVCGDCTDNEVVNAVAFGNADLIVTDPPYGVSYADKNKYLNAVAKGNSIQTAIKGDHLTIEEVTVLWRLAFGNLFDIAKPGCVYYINAPQGGDLMMMMMMLSEVGWLLKPQIIWVKNNHVLGRSDYQLKHEPILYGWKPGAGHYFIDSRSEVSTWEIDKPLNSDLHPTEKPLELVERAIRNSSKPGDIVADFFVGSGTTLIGCQNLGRRCMAIDEDPSYIAVALQRWHDLTGLNPQRID